MGDTWRVAVILGPIEAGFRPIWALALRPGHPYDG